MQEITVGPRVSKSPVQASASGPPWRGSSVETMGPLQRVTGSLQHLKAQGKGQMVSPA